MAPSQAPKLQIALDRGDRSTLLRLARETAPYVDWIEAGTPWLMLEGIDAVRALRASFPDRFIVADLKIMDAGRYEAEMGFAAGADLVTVMGAASDATISGALQSARAHGRWVMVDLLQVRDPVRRAREVLELGTHYIGIHAAHDDQRSGKSPLSDLALVSRALPAAAIVVSGGIGPHNLQEVIQHRPAVVIVGSAITGAADPAGVARRLRQMLEEAWQKERGG